MSHYIYSDDGFDWAEIPGDEDHHHRPQTHVHEFEGSTMLAEQGEDRHNHRFAGVSGEAIYSGRSHFHFIETRTDFVDHFHKIFARTGPAVIVNPGDRFPKHIHFVDAFTTVVDDHRHHLEFATLIEAPLLPMRG